MQLFPTYDVAFSVAEEDVEVAKKIAAAFKSKNIKYYLYTEQDNWGKPLMKVSLQTYKGRSRYVLMIVSNNTNTKDKHWGKIERHIMHLYKPGRKEFILPLVIDNATVPGLQEDIIFRRWADDPDVIAKTIHDKLSRRLTTERVFSLLLSMVVFCPLIFIASQKILPDNSAVTKPDSSARKDIPVRTDTSSKRIFQPAPQKDQFRGIFIEGTVTDKLTNDPLDSVTVTINGQVTFAKNGQFRIPLSLHKVGGQVSLRCSIRKAGYETLTYNETVFINRLRETHVTDAKLAKLNPSP